MNDKQQLAAMGAELRLTEEQAKAMAERMPQTGTLQILDDEPLCTEIRINGVEACGADIGGLLDRCLPHTTEQKPLCMAKRIEELEAQVRVMGDLLREATGWMDDHPAMPDSNRMHEALSGRMPSPSAPEGWQMVPVKLTKEMDLAADPYAEGKLSHGFMWSDMLAAAPKPEVK